MTEMEMLRGLSLLSELKRWETAFTCIGSAGPSSINVQVFDSGPLQMDNCVGSVPQYVADSVKQFIVERVMEIQSDLKNLGVDFEYSGKIADYIALRMAA